MRYLGGKQRVALHFKDIINPLLNNKIYVEPFIGGLGATMNFTLPREYHLSDNNPYIISLYRSIMDGWVPPSNLTEEDYMYYRDLNKNNILYVKDPMAAFVGFGCSYSGKWFGGLARENTGRNLASETKSNLLAKCLPILLGCSSLSCIDYEDLLPDKSCVVYCDPPYLNTTNGYLDKSFSHEEFWNVMREWVENGSLVVISEFSAPKDFIKIFEKERKIYTNHNVSKIMTEKLFCHESQQTLII